MFRSDLTGQPGLFAFTVRDLIADDSDVWLYADLFDALDLLDFDADYVSQGKPGIEPKLMLRTLFYGLTHGVVSGRRLSEVCRNDCRYAVLSGEQQPDARTFQRFIVRHSKRLDQLFVEVVRLAQRMDLLSLGKIALDGSRFKANSSKHKAMSYGRMEKAITEIKGELSKLKESFGQESAGETFTNCLPAEIKLREKRLAKIMAAKEALEKDYAEAQVPQSAQKSFADHNAMPMAKSGEAFMYGYNCQAAVDEKNQIIVAADLHDVSNDYGALGPMIEEVERNCGRAADQILVDSGYRSNANIAAIERAGSTPYVATGKGEDHASVDEIKHHVELSTDNNGRLIYLCPAGKNMRMVSKSDEATCNVRLPRRACKKCQFADECPLIKRGRRIRVPRPEHFAAVTANLARMRTDEGRLIYRRRKVIVEPVFGNIKNKGIKILVRGRAKVRTWWRLACTAHNIEKLIRALPPTEMSVALH
jgi:transposase